MAVDGGFGGCSKEHEKEVEKLKKVITELADIIASLKNRNAEWDEKRKKALNDYYETAAKLEDAQGLIVKLWHKSTIIMKIHSCLPQNALTGKKPGAQTGHLHHPRKPMEPDQVVEIPVEEKLKDSSRYIPTGNIISRQVIGITVVPVVTEYRIAEFYDKKKGWNVHSTFPGQVTDDVNYDGSIPCSSKNCFVSMEFDFARNFFARGTEYRKSKLPIFLSY